MIHAETDDGYPINIPDNFHGYKFIDILGAGSTSVVILVLDENTGEQFSAKIIPKKYILNKKLYNQINTEIYVMKQVDHPNIVKFREFFKFKNELHETYYALVMEYCENGDLLTYVNDDGFESEDQKQKIIIQFLDAVKYLHNLGIAHGDLKPENILLDSNYNVKLADFGFSKVKKIAGDESKSGTLFYAAPELFKSGKFNTLKTDIWSIGIILYCLEQGNFPYLNGSQDFIIEQITSHRFNIEKNVSSSLRKIFDKCTDCAEKRPSIEELVNDEYFLFDEKITADLNNEIDYNNSCGNILYY